MDAAEIDKELEELESKAEHLRALYEQYFMGMERIEPLVMRRDVERRVIVLRREQLRNTAQRFKFNTLVQRFNTMQQHWARVVREIENGTYKRDVIRAAARFGEGALAILGKKKTRDIVAAVARAQEKQEKRTIEDGAYPPARLPVDSALELGVDDLIEEDEDEAPTPPKLGPGTSVWPVAMGETQPVSEVPGLPAGLGQGDLPVVGPPAPAGPPGAMGPLPQPVAPPRRSGGLRWGPAPPSDPGSAIRPAGGQPVVGFGELDLDFVEAPAMPAAASPRAASRAGAFRPMGPLPAVTAPPMMGPLPTVTAPAARFASPAASSTQPPALSGFGVLDIPLDGESPAAAASPAPGAPSDAAPSSPGSGIRPGANRSVRSPVAGPAHPAGQAGRADGDLPDQRIRQIYAKYVEAKRSTQESTAGVTFDKLAASLRAQATKLKSAHPNRSIDYEVVVKDGKTHLKPVLR